MLEARGEDYSRLILTALDGGDMSTAGVYETRTHLSQLLQRVANGETITITRHGVPVAVLAPPPMAPKTDVKTAIARMQALRMSRKEPGLSVREIRDMIEEGRG